MQIAEVTKNMSDNYKIKENLINSKNDLIEYLSNKALNHKNYKYYTKSRYVKNILDNNTIYLSNGLTWNDTIDRENFNCKNSEYANFGVCLCFSKSENVAMWMLYSGNDGCMIDYDAQTIKAIYDTPTIELGKFDNNVFKSKIKLHKEQFEISIFDIIYYDPDTMGKETSNSEVYVKRSDEVNRNFPKEIIGQLGFQKKTLPWSYENECRIVVTVKKQLLENQDVDSAAIEFPKKCVDKLKQRTLDSPNATKSEYEDSYLKSKINWNLCSDCEKQREVNNVDIQM